MLSRTRCTLPLIMAVLCALALAVAAPDAQQRAAFKDSRERISYALGVEAGQQFVQRAIELDPDAFANGLKDVLTGRTPRLTDDQVKAAIAEMQSNLKRREFDLRSARAEASRKAADAFLAENAKKPGVVVLPSGAQYRVLAPGSGRKPTDDDVVELNYRGTLTNGMEFDSSSRGGGSPMMQVGQAIAGLREALKLMPVGAKWQIFVPPSLASGSRSSLAAIPPNEALIYEVEILSIK